MSFSLDDLGVDIHTALFQTAYTHKSFANEGEGVEHNERLEFLGDAVLELLITEELFHCFPEEPEGRLTKFRSALVKGAFLAERAREFGLGEKLRLSKGEEAANGRNKNPLLANTFEAFLGALYLEYGMEKSRNFLQAVVFPYIESVEKRETYMDPKSDLQEWAQENHGITPHYVILQEAGPDHSKRFLAGVFLEKQKMGQGEGSSKQKAEVAAAEDGLKNAKL